MAMDPRKANYGRGDMGQFSPFRDQPKRRFAEEDEAQYQPEQQPAPEPAPSPLARAVAPKSFTVTGSADGTSTMSEPRPAETNRGSYRFSAPPLKSGSLASVSQPGDDGAQGLQNWMRSESRLNSETRTPTQSPLATAVAPQGGAGYALSGIGGAGGGSNVFSGFDFGQSEANRDTGKSAKYAFADLASQSGAAMPTTKQGAEEWFRTHIAPGMQALGHEVLDVKGDKALIRNWQGEGWVDFLVNADGASPSLAWQAEGMASGATDPLASAIGGQAADPVAMMHAQQMGIDTNNPLWKQILDQLISEQSGQAEQTQQTPQFGAVPRY